MSEIKLVPYSTIYKGDHIITMDTTVQDCIDYIQRTDKNWELSVEGGIYGNRICSCKDGVIEGTLPRDLYHTTIRGFQCERIFENEGVGLYKIMIF